MATVMKDDFEISLFSNRKNLPGAAPNKFTCTLDPPVLLDPTFKWDVGISKMSMSTCVKLLGSYSKNAHLTFEGYKGRKMVCEFTLTLPMDFSVWRPEDLLYSIRQSEEYTRVYISEKKTYVDFNSCFKLAHEQSTGKFKGLVIPNNDASITEIIIRCNHPHLQKCLGMEEAISCQSDRYTTFPEPAQILHMCSYMQVKCSLCHSLGLFPLAAWMMDRSLPMVDRTFTRPIYKDCHTTSFNDIAVELVNQRGDCLEIAPGGAPTSLELTFKRTGIHVP